MATGCGHFRRRAMRGFGFEARTDFRFALASMIRSPRPETPRRRSRRSHRPRQERRRLQQDVRNRHLPTV